MLKTSVTSITFRQKSIDEILFLAKLARLDAIEWGGDVHLPPGALDLARQVGRKTRAAGLGVSAYGSYYRADPGEDFAPVLATAKAVGAKVIRVWAGRQGSAACPPEQRAQITAQLARAAAMAKREGCTVATEYHANTLTDTLASAQTLLREADGLRTFWQPPVGLPAAENRQALQALGPAVVNLHVYNWNAHGKRLPLCAGADEWRGYLALARSLPGLHYATLEFVYGDSENQLLLDATALQSWIREEV